MLLSDDAAIRKPDRLDAADIFFTRTHKQDLSSSETTLQSQ
jgi:hypothetical protein